MVTWGRAWKAAGTWFVWSLVWEIIGFILVGTGIFTMLGSGVLDLSVGLPAGLVLIIGVIVIQLGAVSSFFKINSELISEEVKTQLDSDFDATLTEEDGKFTCLLCKYNNFHGDAGQIVEHLEQMHNVDRAAQVIYGWNTDFEEKARVYLKRT